MNRTRTLHVFGWLVRDTFKQARASGLGAVAVVLTLIAAFVCLSAEVRVGPQTKLDPDQPAEFLPADDIEAGKTKHDRAVVLVDNRLTLLFGRVEISLARDAEDGVRFLHYLFASGVSENLGLFLALIWTAGFLPTFLQPSNVTVLLTKPTPRWLLLVGKYIGVLLFVAVHASAFVLSTWFALGLKTQVWNTVYLAAAPMLVVQFASFFGFSVLLATLFRSSIASALGALLCWAVCAGVNIAHHSMSVAETKVQTSQLKNESRNLVAATASAAAEQAASLESSVGRRNPKYSAALVSMVQAGYWILPKPIDLGFIVFRELRAGDFVASPPTYDALTSAGPGHLQLSVLTSLAFAAFLVFAAARQFQFTDY